MVLCVYGVRGVWCVLFIGGVGVGWFSGGWVLVGVGVDVGVGVGGVCGVCGWCVGVCVGVCVFVCVCVFVLCAFVVVLVFFFGGCVLCWGVVRVALWLCSGGCIRAAGWSGMEPGRSAVLCILL